MALKGFKNSKKKILDVELGCGFYMTNGFTESSWLRIKGRRTEEWIGYGFSVVNGRKFCRRDVGNGGVTVVPRRRDQRAIYRTKNE